MNEPKEPLHDLESLTKTKEKEPGPDTEENDSDDIIVVDEESEDTEDASDPSDPSDEHPNQKKQRAKKRIEGLIKTKHDQTQEIESLKQELADLKAKEQQRTSKEVDAELKLLDEKKKEAFESSDYDEFQKYETQMNKIKSSAQMDTQDADNYFKSKNPWYKVDEAKTKMYLMLLRIGRLPALSPNGYST